MKQSQYKVVNRPRGYIVGAQWGFPMLMPGGGYEYLKMPVEARVVSVTVGTSDDPQHWATIYAGTRRRAVEVHVVGKGVDETFYIDNADGHTPKRMISGTILGMRQLPVAEVLEDNTIQPTYRPRPWK